MNSGSKYYNHHNYYFIGNCRWKWECHKNSVRKCLGLEEGCKDTHWLELLAGLPLVIIDCFKSRFNPTDNLPLVVMILYLSIVLTNLSEGCDSIIARPRGAGKVKGIWLSSIVIPVKNIFNSNDKYRPNRFGILITLNFLFVCVCWMLASIHVQSFSSQATCVSMK